MRRPVSGFNRKIKGRTNQAQRRSMVDFDARTFVCEALDRWICVNERLREID